jgi:PelA/Pel-15E family pectate lyase
MKTLKSTTLILIFFMTLSVVNAQKVTNEKVLEILKNAAEYMDREVAVNGGYVWYYSTDLSQYFGESPSRKTQIWCYGEREGGTPSVGHLYMDVYEATGEEIFLLYAKKAANALIAGQHQSGGWHYMIDFDRVGTQEWYDKVASQQAQGMEEWRYNFLNCTFDDGATTEPIMFLLRLYMKTLDPAYKLALDKALNFILEAQYPNGGWPQRYPMDDERTPGGFPKYPVYYTLNDGVLQDNVSTLLEAYEAFGDERYLESAKKGGDFLMIAQGPKEQAGWAEQYDMNLKPAWARTHEPPGFMPRETLESIYTLERLFLFTGDRRFLRPVEDAFDWLEKVKLEEVGDVYVFPRYITPGIDNLPLRRINLIDEPRTEEGYVRYNFFTDLDSEYATLPGEMGERSPLRVRKAKEIYNIVKNVSEEDRFAMYLEFYKGRRSHQIDGKFPTSMESNKKPETPDKVKESDVWEILNSANENNMWIGTIRVLDNRVRMEKSHEGDMLMEIPGISIETYSANMRTLAKWIEQNK